jgi:2-amino-4-hydroxy-6-hydroxymethyldihydropteridine diphosphokinase
MLILCMQSTRAYIGIGSNLDEPISQVHRALQALREISDSCLIAQSPLYRTVPLGGPLDQPDYINAVAVLDTRLTPYQLLISLQSLELAQNRTRTIRWGPRTIDLDLLLYGQLVNDDPQLTIPHPRMHQRAFVIYPMYDVAPSLVIPGMDVLLSTLLNDCCQQELYQLGSKDSLN